MVFLLIGGLAGSFLFAFALRRMIGALVQGKDAQGYEFLLGVSAFLMWVSIFVVCF